MITLKKVKVCFLLIIVFVNTIYIAPCYSLSSREDLFKIIGITSDGFDNFIKENELHIFDSINEFTFKELVLLKKLIDKTS